ncbi:MmgE/PrpD family protein [Acerihabitans arboris]|uniref:MmgE/PrpD family protein n=1 Tax=Acerihabitans arboris TaxID=2691583 RepID=A0A845SEE6_9GAMM|nr:MmgE/PrpD family protein [Acerihabitans arboris]NDL61747.1 MmgE/PrpD family protein [Acerihabitans arboris]
MNVIEAIAAWSRAQDGFSRPARELARRAIVDTLACLYAGRGDFSTLAVRTAGEPYLRRDYRARVIGGGRAPAAIAALINGTSAHAIDYDDNFGPGMSHASAVLVPALLAAADELNAGGGQLVDAYLIGLQAQAFIGAGVGPSHYTAGWHGTSTVGCIGTAAGVAWLMGLDQAGIARALSNAVSFASGTKGQFGTPIKPLHAGWAARNAIEAAVLAQRGMRGRIDILEAPQGFGEMFGGAAPSGWDIPAILGTRPHVIESVGVMPKRHPCCGSTHMIIDALSDLRDTHDFTDADVVSADTLVGIANQRNLAYAVPENEMQARFSMHYCVDTWLRNGALSVLDFTPARVAQQTDPARLARITLRAYRAEQEAGGKLPHRVTLTLRDGRRLEAERRLAKGSNTEPFSEAERRQKFIDCCAGLELPDRLFDRLKSLGDAGDLGYLDALLVE